LSLRALVTSLSSEYRHYGPYSEDLARGMEIASGVGLVSEEERRADWGGKYSTYRPTSRTPATNDAGRSRFVMAAKEIGAIELELPQRPHSSTPRRVLDGTGRATLGPKLPDVSRKKRWRAA